VDGNPTEKYTHPTVKLPESKGAVEVRLSVNLAGIVGADDMSRVVVCGRRSDMLDGHIIKDDGLHDLDFNLIQREIDERDKMLASLATNMTLRDYFAGQAMSLMPLSDSEKDFLATGIKPKNDIAASFCYGFADAMLKAREVDSE